VLQTVGSSGKNRTENKWDVSGVQQSAQLKFPSEAHQEERVTNRQNTCSW
jgi:hypothetical protein